MTGFRRLIVAAATAWAASGGQPTQERAAEIVVAVEAQSGAQVAGLAAGDFTVHIDDVPAAVVGLERSMRALAVVVMADQSPSVSGLTTVRDDALSEPLPRGMIDDFLPALASGDELRLGKIAGDIVVGRPVPLTRRDLQSALSFWEPTTKAFSDYGGSPIWDAVAEAIESLSALPDAAVRRLVVLMTDGRATANRLSVEEAAERAVRNRVVISAVAEGQPALVRQDDARAAGVRPDRALTWLAETTGGMFLPDATAFGRPRTENQPGVLFARAVNGLRNAYALRVMIRDDGRPKTLKISVRRPDVIVRAARVVI